MTDAHTPGPWTADLGDAGPFGVFDENGSGIAYMAEPNQRATALPYVESGRYRETDWDAHQANARLIAAAPEMLAALEAQVECTTMMMNKLGGFTPRDIADCTSQAKNAIAKARHISFTKG